MMGVTESSHMHVSDEEGKIAVKLARDAIEAAVKGMRVRSRELPDIFMKSYGVFTTINTFPPLHLRGCIGVPDAAMPLGKAIVRSAVSASLADPRFPRVRVDELDRIVVEVSLMTKPELVEVNSPEEYLKKIVVGRDGLVLMSPFHSGFLLPQVPVEHGWDVKRFLRGICEKSGMKGNCWKGDDVELQTFQAEIFHELSPHGEIKRKVL